MRPGTGYEGEEGDGRSEAHLPASLVYFLLFETCLGGIGVPRESLPALGVGKQDD